jgi:tight adherence protein B
MLEPSEVAQCDEVIIQSLRSGVPLRGLLTALDSRAVDRAFHNSTMRARELGERLLIPLGACTLPAFLCLGVVPAIISVVSDTRLGF